ncbi:NUDIX hydrolase [Nocardioides sp. SYSU DS0663]|uniref:NUDIX hydrolase n=1 Tax=Nocardioides sp. SYSU DS0663 TaxID=3416445 RepID=UPI003F4C213F
MSGDGWVTVWGTTEPPIRVERATGPTGLELHRVVVGNALPGAVVLAERDDEVLLVSQYRPAIGRRCWELPRGFADHSDGGDPLVAAARELFEETGLVLEGSRSIGSVYPDTGLLAGAVAIVAGTVAHDDDPGDPGTDGEVDEVRWVDRHRFRSMVESGEICDGISLGAALVGRWC